MPGKAMARASLHPAGGFLASALLISRPGIAAGVTLSGLSGMVLAGKGLPPPGLGAVCLACIIMAACGSAVANGLLDADMDARMRRLDARVSALEKVGRKEALAISLALTAGSLTLSLLFLPAAASLLLLAAIGSYTALYTIYFKRRSPYGSVPGGIPGALPVLIGYAAVEPRLGADGILLFLLMLLWQPPHFWALALKHKEDYRSAGFPVMPVALGEPYTKILIFVYASALLPLSMGMWWLGYCSAAFAASAIALGAYFLFSCYRNIVASPRFGRAFGASIVYIMGILLAVIVDVSARSIR